MPIGEEAGNIANLKLLELQIKKREHALGLQQEMLEHLEAIGASEEEIAKQEEKVNKLKEIGNSLTGKRLDLEISLGDAIEKQELKMQRLAAAGALFMSTLNGIVDAEKAASDLTRSIATEMNINVKEASALNAELSAVLTNGKQDLVTREEAVAMMKEMKDVSGGLRDLTGEQAANMMIATKQLGISANESAVFADMMAKTGGHSAETSMNFLNGLKNLSKMKGVKFDKVMGDIAAHGKDLQGFLGKGAEEISLMAVATRKLGFELGDVKGIANQLYDTESRIENQMTLNQVLQKDMNFDKAAQLMMEGKTEEAMAEYKKQLGDTTKLTAYERNLVQEKLGINLYNLENAAQIAEQERLTAEKQQEQADLKDQLLQLQLEEFDLKATEREEAATEREQADMAEAERNKKMNDFVNKQIEWMDLSKTLKYIQLGIQGAMAAQAIAAGFLSAAQKESLRASIAALPKLVAAAVSRAAAAVSALVTNAAATFGIGTVIALAAAAGGAAWLYSNIAKAEATPTGDLGIDPNGGPIVMSPTEGGIFQGTKNDGVSMSPSHGTKGGGMDSSAIISKLDQLIAAVEKNRVISVDGYQLNEAVHLEKIPSGMS